MMNWGNSPAVSTVCLKAADPRQAALFGDVDVLSHSTSSPLRDIAGRVDSISESQRAQLASLATAFHEINQAIHDISNHAQLTSDQTHAAQSVLIREWDC